MILASPIAVASTGKEGVAQPDQQSQKHDAEDQTAGNQFFLDGQERLILHLLQLVRKFWLVRHGTYPVARGGLTPWKNSHEMARPIQMMNPKRHTTETAARRPIPSSRS